MTVQPTVQRQHSSALTGATDPRTLFARWQRDHDPAAREALVQRYMPLARSLTRRYGRSSEPFEDLLQVASLGLLKAIDRYDVERGHPFQSFAVPTILGEMRRYFRDSGWAIHVPRGAQERALKVRDAQERIANDKGTRRRSTSSPSTSSSTPRRSSTRCRRSRPTRRSRSTRPGRAPTTTPPSTATRSAATTSATSSSSSTRRFRPCSATSRRASA